jgi:hypothetical protein
MHNSLIPHAHWPSEVKGFQGWGVRHFDNDTGEEKRYDVLSGNRVLLVPALVAFLGMEQVSDGEESGKEHAAETARICAIRSGSTLFGGGMGRSIEMNVGEISKRLRMCTEFLHFRATGDQRYCPAGPRDASSKIACISLSGRARESTNDS